MDEKMSEPIKVGMKPPHVGSFILEEVIEPLGLNITQVSEILGVRRATLSDLVNEKSNLSAEMAVRLEKAFGVDVDMLLSMQKWYDLAEAREHADMSSVRRYVA